ncbi:MAG TPA: hypothetical protein VFT65_13575 [Candidatus Angelobacter sp.]|nr:hypothetical protein [Candidatus Angelobacter sp.]
MAGFAGIALYKAERRAPVAHGTQKTDAPPSSINTVPVEHGGVARPQELHGHGKLYLVPVGSQVIPTESLADYYRHKFGIDIAVLPELKVRPSACISARRQCIADELITDMANAYPDISRAPESVMIALTDEDIFIRNSGGEFTYSAHSARLGIVSTRRMDPAFWGDPSNDAFRLASTRQMLTKYIAIEYFHLPESFDPSSVLFSPLTPNGGSDDIYESDLHSEASANGMRGVPFPCLYFSYSYKTHEITQDGPSLSECKYRNIATSTDEERFDLNLGFGSFSQRSLDIGLGSSPPIELKRGFAVYNRPMAFAFGWNTNHSYNPWLASDGLAALTFLNVNREDGAYDSLQRVTPGRGFSPVAVYQSSDDALNGARMLWSGDHYKLQYRDGAWSTFLPCVTPNSFCYWTGYQDAKGNSLQFERGPNLELVQLTASDKQGISFQSDAQLRTTSARATDGTQVTYEYDPAGCLARVTRADGQQTRYEYDAAHQMTSISVVERPGARPETILTNEYDARGRVIKQTLRGLGSYQFKYVSSGENYASQVQVTAPGGEVTDIQITPTQFVAQRQPVRFPAIAHP